LNLILVKVFYGLRLWNIIAGLDGYTVQAGRCRLQNTRPCVRGRLDEGTEADEAWLSSWDRN
jgi:hypothetical protein